MFYRQKILLAMIEVFGRNLSNLDLQKYLFLYTEKYPTDKSYEFVPYKFGCFSFQSYADRRNLIDAGYLSKTYDWRVSPENNFLSMLKEKDQTQLIKFKEHYQDTFGKNLLRDVYVNYPYYAINSTIAKDILSPKEMKQVESYRNTDSSHCFFTIGYEGSSFENYLNRLIKNNIKLLCDVRKNPLSRKYGFSKKTLSKTLSKLGIEYVHIPELGIISERRQRLETKQDYQRLFDEYERTTLQENHLAIRRLFDLLLDKRRIAITCFEETQCMCHRGRVARALSELPGWDYPIEHI